MFGNLAGKGWPALVVVSGCVLPLFSSFFLLQSEREVESFALPSLGIPSIRSNESSVPSALSENTVEQVGVRSDNLEGVGVENGFGSDKQERWIAETLSIKVVDGEGFLKYYADVKNDFQNLEHQTEMWKLIHETFTDFPFGDALLKDDEENNKNNFEKLTTGYSDIVERLKGWHDIATKSRYKDKFAFVIAYQHETAIGGVGILRFDAEFSELFNGHKAKTESYFDDRPEVAAKVQQHSLIPFCYMVGIHVRPAYRVLTKTFKPKSKNSFTYEVLEAVKKIAKDSNLAYVTAPSPIGPMLDILKARGFVGVDDSDLIKVGKEQDVCLNNAIAGRVMSGLELSPVDELDVFFLTP